MLIEADAKALDDAKALGYNRGMNTKTCPRCKQTKDKSQFYANKCRPDGCNSYCIPCQKEQYLSKPRQFRCEHHGKHKTKEYQCWADMKTRCDNRAHKSYVNYGHRGISYCESWKLFSNFYKDMGDRPMGLTLERLDNDSDYSPENCVWADRSQQNRNKRYPSRSKVG
jgi:hypothetical protein